MSGIYENIYFGNTQVTKVYKGNALVWSDLSKIIYNLDEEIYAIKYGKRNKKQKNNKN